MASPPHPIHTSTAGILGTELPKNIKLVLLSTFVYVIAWGILEPFLPLYIKEIAGSYTLTGILFAVLSLFIFIFSIPVGDFVDKTNSGKILRGSLLFYPLIAVIYVFASQLWHLVLARIMHAIANPLHWVSLESFIRQNTDKQNNLKAFGWYATAKSLGIMLGAFVGAFLVLFLSLNQLFWSLIPVSLIGLWIIRKIGKSDSKETFSQAINEIWKKDKVFKKEFTDFFALGKTAVILAILVFFGSIMAHIIFFVVPLVSEEINLGLPGLAVLYGVINIPYLFCFLLAGLAGREGKIKIIEIGLILMTLILAALFFLAHSVFFFVFLCFALSFVIALVSPAINSIISDISPDVEKGEITGFYYGMFFLGGAAGPIIFGIIADTIGLDSIFLISAAIAFELFAIVFFFRKQIIE